ncbi:BBE domain-containing protein [Streptomyces decoyicus]
MTALKADYDPRNIFRLNYNIPPHTAGDVNCSETS